MIHNKLTNPSKYRCFTSALMYMIVFLRSMTDRPPERPNQRSPNIGEEMLMIVLGIFGLELSRSNRLDRTIICHSFHFNPKHFFSIQQVSNKVSYFIDRYQIDIRVYFLLFSIYFYNSNRKLNLNISGVWQTGDGRARRQLASNLIDRWMDGARLRLLTFSIFIALSQNIYNFIFGSI